MFNSSFLVRTHKGIFVINIDDIAFFKASGSYSELFFVNGSKLLISKTISLIERKLKKCGFIRCHNSYYVNASKIKYFNRVKNTISICIYEIPVSRRKRSRTVQILRAINNQL
jgi:two-component system LytT family response regulator